MFGGDISYDTQDALASDFIDVIRAEFRRFLDDYKTLFDKLNKVDKTGKCVWSLKEL